MSACNNNSLTNGSAVRRARLDAGLSQLQLALRAGISRWRLRLAEQGFCKLRSRELGRIRRVLERSRA
jgi:transcriptional regulator with XRE-family HTH domain